jgi:hypothetical protein
VYSFPLLTSEVRKHRIPFYFIHALTCHWCLLNHSSFAVFFAKHYANCPPSQSPTSFLISNWVVGQLTSIQSDWVG